MNSLNLKNSSSAADMGKLAVMVILIIVAVYILYRIYKYASTQIQTRNTNQPMLVTTPTSASTDVTNAPSSVPISKDGLTYSYSGWLYISNWTYRYNTIKTILTTGNNNTLIQLGAQNNDLSITQKTNGDSVSVVANNIPLQKWVHYAIVLNNRNIDIYVDGKLEATKVLPSVPVLGASSGSNLTLNMLPIGDDNKQGFYGQISKTQYFTKALQPQEVFDLYEDGPFINTNFKLNLLNDGALYQMEQDAAADLNRCSFF